MIKKIFGASFEQKIGAALVAIGTIAEILTDTRVLTATPAGKYIAAVGLIYATFNGKSNKVTTSVDDVNVRIPNKP